MVGMRNAARAEARSQKVEGVTAGLETSEGEA